MKHKDITIMAAVAIVLIYASTPAFSALVGQIVSPMVSTICQIYSVMYTSAGGIAALIITISGFRWVGSAEDPGIRKSAKDTILHTLVGMLLIVIATALVQLITGQTGCPTI
ncbi:MAG: TrbC/VirB2 family protein [Candidatus Altiarchaeota archaeon]